MNKNYMANNENNNNSGSINYGFQFSNCTLENCSFHDNYSKKQVPELNKIWSFLLGITIAFIFFVCNFFKLRN